MTDWSTIIPDEPAPPHNKNFADHSWEDLTEGRVCRNCSLRWQDVLGEGAAPAMARILNVRRRKWKPNATGCGQRWSTPRRQGRNDGSPILPAPTIRRTRQDRQAPLMRYAADTLDEVEYLVRHQSRH